MCNLVVPVPDASAVSPSPHLVIRRAPSPRAYSVTCTTAVSVRSRTAGQNGTNPKE